MQAVGFGLVIVGALMGYFVLTGKFPATPGAAPAPPASGAGPPTGGVGSLTGRDFPGRRIQYQ